MDHVVGLHREGHRLPHRHVQLTGGDARIGVMEDEGELHRRHVDRQWRFTGAGLHRHGADAGPGAAVTGVAVHGVHAVVVERRHAAHAVVDVVAVDADEQHHHGGDGCPEDFQRQVALDGNPVPLVAVDTAKAHQAVNNQPGDADQQDRANAEENLEKFVVDGCVEAGILRQEVDVLTHPKPCENQGHAGQECEDGCGNPHGPRC